MEHIDTNDIPGILKQEYKVIVHWRHILLDPAIFNVAGTFSIAKVKVGGLEGLDAFPRANSGLWFSKDYYVSLPKAEAVAPPSYDYDGRHFIFKNWFLRIFKNRKLDYFDTPTDFGPAFPRGSSEKDFIEVFADALYYWDFGVGGGDHMVIIDAINVTAGKFITDDFVTVTPDETGELTRTANKKNFILTGGISNLTVAATKQIIRPELEKSEPTESQPSKIERVILDFQEWRENQSFGKGSPTYPEILGSELRLKANDIIWATAYYTEQRIELAIPESPINQGLILGTPTDGGFVVVLPSGLKRIPPLDPRAYAALTAITTVQLDQEKRMAEIISRLEILENKRKE